MSASRVQPVQAPAQKATSPRGPRSAGGRAKVASEMMEPVPPPLPTDTALRAELFARLDRSIASAQAGRLSDWEDVDRRTRQKLGLPPA